MVQQTCFLAIVVLTQAQLIFNITTAGGGGGGGYSRTVVIFFF